MKKLKCNEKPIQDWFDNITYKVQTISFLLEETKKNTTTSKAFHNSAAYLSGYPVEFLIKMAICLSGELEYPALHASKELLDNYKMTLKSSPAQQLIDLNVIRIMPIARLDINQFRYNPNSNFETFGYQKIEELLNDLAKVATQANNLKKKFFSKFAS